MADLVGSYSSCIVLNSKATAYLTNGPGTIYTDDPSLGMISVDDELHTWLLKKERNVYLRICEDPSATYTGYCCLMWSYDGRSWTYLVKDNGGDDWDFTDVIVDTVGNSDLYLSVIDGSATQVSLVYLDLDIGENDYTFVNVLTGYDISTLRIVIDYLVLGVQNGAVSVIHSNTYRNPVPVWVTATLTDGGADFLTIQSVGYDISHGTALVGGTEATNNMAVFYCNDLAVNTWTLLDRVNWTEGNPHVTIKNNWYSILWLFSAYDSNPMSLLRGYYANVRGINVSTPTVINFSGSAGLGWQEDADGAAWGYALGDLTSDDWGYLPFMSLLSDKIYCYTGFYGGKRIIRLTQQTEFAAAAAINSWDVKMAWIDGVLYFYQTNLTETAVTYRLEPHPAQWECISSISTNRMARIQLPSYLEIGKINGGIILSVPSHACWTGIIDKEPTTNSSGWKEIIATGEESGLTQEICDRNYVTGNNHEYMDIIEELCSDVDYLPFLCHSSSIKVGNGNHRSFDSRGFPLGYCLRTLTATEQYTPADNSGMITYINEHGILYSNDIVTGEGTGEAVKIDVADPANNTHIIESITKQNLLEHYANDSLIRGGYSSINGIELTAVTASPIQTSLYGLRRKTYVIRPLTTQTEVDMAELVLTRLNTKYTPVIYSIIFSRPVYYKLMQKVSITLNWHTIQQTAIDLLVLEVINSHDGKTIVRFGPPFIVFSTETAENVANRLNSSSTLLQSRVPHGGMTIFGDGSGGKFRSNGNISSILGDSLGGYKHSFQNHAYIEKAWIDSLGNASFASITVPGLNADTTDFVHTLTVINNRLTKYNSTGTKLEDSAITEIAGALSGITTLSMSKALTNTLTDGSSPFYITSTTKVGNLNVDRVDGVHVLTTTNGRLTRYNSTGTKLEDSVVTESAGALGSITTISMSNQLTNTLNNGSAPLKITSNVLNPNVNVQYLNGHEDSYFLADANDIIKDTHIDWGTGVNQVSALDVPIADAGNYYIGTEVEAALQEVGLRFLDINEPTGFTNRTDSNFSFAVALGVGTLSVTTGSSYVIWFKGISHTISVTKTIDIADTEGQHLIYFDTDDDLHEYVNPDYTDMYNAIMNKCLVAFVQWDATGNDDVFLGEERHGITMDGSTHFYLHYTQGLKIIDPTSFGLGDFVIGNGSLDTHAQFSVATGKIADEDIGITVAQVDSTDGMPILYKLGAAGNWRELTQAGFAVYQNPAGGTNRLMYNQYTGGAWQLTEVGEGNYVLCHIFVGTGKSTQVFAIMGETEYTTQKSAKDGAQTEIGNIFLGTLPSPEFRPVATVIFQTDKDYGNTINARVIEAETGGDDYISWVTTAMPRGTVIPPHGQLTGLLNDDHTQYFLADGSRSITGQITNTLADGGSPPLVITSTVKNINLNADRVDDKHISAAVGVTGALSITADTFMLHATAATAITIAHLTTAGNIHLPAAGSANQLLKNSGAAGTASWGTVTENAGALAAVTTIGMSNQLTNTVADGTAPFVITSTTKVTNLNAEHWNDKHLGSVTTTKLVRYNSTGTQLETGTVAETSGALSAITTLGMSGQLTNTLAIGAPPFIITSTTKVANLNVEQVDGYDFNQDVRTTGTPSFASVTADNLKLDGNELTATGDFTLNCNGTNTVMFFSSEGLIKFSPNTDTTANNNLLIEIGTVNQWNPKLTAYKSDGVTKNSIELNCPMINSAAKQDDIGTATYCFDDMYADDFVNVASDTKSIFIKQGEAERIFTQLKGVTGNGASRSEGFDQPDYSKFPEEFCTKFYVKKDKIGHKEKVPQNYIPTKDETVEIHHTRSLVKELDTYRYLITHLLKRIEALEAKAA